MSKARMTIRFDGQKPTDEKERQRAASNIIPLRREEYHVIEEEQRKPQPPEEDPFRDGELDVSDPHPFNSFTNDYGTWSSPFDEETMRLERLIRETEYGVPVQRDAKRNPVEKRERENRHRPDADEPDARIVTVKEPETGSYVSEQLQHDLAGPVIPRSEVELDGERFHYSRDVRDDRWFVEEEPAPARLARFSSKRNDRLTWGRVAVSMTGAVVTGLLIGSLTLSLFAGPKGNSTVQTDSIGGGSAVTPQQPGAAAGGETKAAAAAPGVQQPGNTAAAPAAVPAASYFILQHGVFTSEDTAKAALAALQKKNVGAVMTKADKYYVYAGISALREDAQEIGSLLKKAKADFYIKTIDVPGPSLSDGKGPEQMKAYFDKSNALVQMIVSLSSSHLASGEATAIEPGPSAKVQAAYQEWAVSAKAAESFITGDSKAWEDMNTQLSTAVVAMESYAKKPGAAYLWQAQTAVLGYVLKEKEWIGGQSGT